MLAQTTSGSPPVNGTRGGKKASQVEVGARLGKLVPASVKITVYTPGPGFFSPLSRMDVSAVLVVVAATAVVVVLPVHERVAVVLVIRLGGPNHPAWSILVADLSVILTVIRRGRHASNHPTWSAYQSSDLAVIVIPPGRRSHPTSHS
ncbi:hypothetical protein AZE42_01854 [Rhizopogon vesiculosus]|uniref:Uncharacterized protein n=1 Tax=Rhizopogon vesiculosus TaxID=180088 RepID=A0A1J8QE51_9AGAM|nr:hypothetical protein AZE42_01854 [Rhizopogon vesiculosus]